MIGTIIFSIAVLLEIIFVVARIWKKKNYKKEKSILNIGELVFFLIFIAFGVIHFSFRWKLLLVLLILKGVFGIYDVICKKKVREFKLAGTILNSAGCIVILTFATLPALIFPQFEYLEVTGEYEIDTAVYTWEDKSRLETFETDGSNRQVTVQIWYPKTDEIQKFPLVIFSHGAFGFRMSNYSTYAELASNGYVVCSIDHPYHAFYVKQTDGKTITVNPEFLESVSTINAGTTTEDEIFNITREWMELRMADVNFVLDTIKEQTMVQTVDNIFRKIDMDKIGVMGHSLGGATAVSIGRQRTDIDAVIDLDGTMLGEETACNDNIYTINEMPYPVPLLCIDTTGHYEEGLTYGDQYVNNVILKNAVDGKEIHFDNTEHMDFTDLVFFSPFLASLLGSGDVDKTNCIETMNGVILNYYNHYLKQTEELNLQERYSF